MACTSPNGMCQMGKDTFKKICRRCKQYKPSKVAKAEEEARKAGESQS